MMMQDAMANPILLGVMLGVVVWIGAAILTGWVAVQNNRSGAGWFFNALIFSPPVALLALAAIPQGE
ncbi:MAG: hypothetical protein ACREJ9_05635 [Candidatus Rokuibacteriota bacterium]